MEWWTRWVDSDVEPSSRWHSTHVGVVLTLDGLGDHLVDGLRTAAQAAEDDRGIAEFASDLNKDMEGYEGEKRLLVKLAATGSVVQQLKRAVDSALDILGVREAQIRATWHQHLHQERENRTTRYERLLDDSTNLIVEMGDDRQQLEVLTRLNDGLDRYSSELSPRELDVISAVYTTVARLSGFVVGQIPDWFATSKHEWSNAAVSSIQGGEAACLQQAAIWAELHHPHVRKFYGACYVGETPFVIHEWGSKRLQLETWRWKDLLGCALALQYVHERGFVHRNLTVDTLLFVRLKDKGVLSGLGLLRPRKIVETSVETGKRQRGRRGQRAQEWSIAADILAFGLAMFKLLLTEEQVAISDTSASPLENWDQQRLRRQSVRQRMRVKHTRSLPDFRPAAVDEGEWHLLAGMCAKDPEARIPMTDAVHQMKALVLREEKRQLTTKKSAEIQTMEAQELRQYVIPTAGLSVEEVLQDADDLCGQVPEEFQAVNRAVYDRLVDIYQQLKDGDALLLVVVENYSLLLWRFFILLEQRSSHSYGKMATICASRSVSNRNYGLHHDIDRLLLSSPLLQNEREVHQWQSKWKLLQTQQQHEREACLSNASQLLSDLNDDERAEALALLQFEARNYRNAYPDCDFDQEMEQIGASTIPNWFIPAHLVELGEHIADGSFGAVYRGTWIGTNVVVKQLHDQMDRKSREDFWREADLWFSLNHDNLVKLFGACHEGRPFFVCEPANRGTLVSFLASKRDQNGGKVRKGWRRLYEAALGLEHLHERGIVHGDLKGNNILVCDDGLNTVKLADFGLSVFVNRGEAAAATGALGAFRWKAPECLLGSGPTFESDVYSFGMCVLEAVTGEFPWGTAMPDEAVKFHVVEERQLPPRPSNFDDLEWGLVQRMCCFAPSERIRMGAVVNILHSFWVSYR
ncbi:hypothetical protein BBJ28_00010252 [Nothophytophthora sp. Chile5]|nr:hypothetical protein BBJ28_00010252 [Nothophytophthora sp. Chile5]